ncbi:hypothetical protein WMF31_26300 [Sorangium sp. So ce1036]|uniref:hypothetical protein n=1 Tax=Sorangium sp. So ce1036 TaxID=3133328 RepID=UPI003F026EE2
MEYTPNPEGGNAKQRQSVNELHKRIAIQARPRVARSLRMDAIRPRLPGSTASSVFSRGRDGERASMSAVE